MTHDELDDLERMLFRMEKNARAWRFMRWIGPVMGVLSMGVGAWAFSQLPDTWHAATPEDFTEPVSASDLMSANASIMGFTLLWFIGTLQASLGTILLVSSLCRWRKGKHDLLLIKMARCWMETQKPAQPSSR